MVDKVALSVAVIALIVAAVSLTYNPSLMRSQEELNTRLSDLEKRIPKEPVEEDLVAAARREASTGPLVMYGVMDLSDVIGIVWPAFKAKYPFAPTVQYIEGFTELRQRFQEEAARGVRTADVRLQDGGDAFSDLGKGLGLRFESKSDSLYQSDQIVDKTLRHAWGNVGVIIYNTNLVKEADAPKSWFDLANPKWNGSIATADPRLDGTSRDMYADLIQTLGENRVRQLFKEAYIDNRARVLNDWGSSVYNSVLAGEHAIGTSLINDVVQQKSGAPVAAAKLTEGVPITRTFAYVYANTPRPNLAKLFVEWFTSEEGQTKVGVTGRVPALRTLDSPSSLKNILPGVSAMPSNLDNYRNPDTWLQKFKDMFREIGIP